MKYVTFECTPEFKVSLEAFARQERRSVAKECLELISEGMALRKETAKGHVNLGQVKAVKGEVVEYLAGSPPAIREASASRKGIPSRRRRSA